MFLAASHNAPRLGKASNGRHARRIIVSSGVSMRNSTAAGIGIRPSRTTAAQAASKTKLAKKVRSVRVSQRNTSSASFNATSAAGVKVSVCLGRRGVDDFGGCAFVLFMVSVTPDAGRASDTGSTKRPCPARRRGSFCVDACFSSRCQTASRSTRAGKRGCKGRGSCYATPLCRRAWKPAKPQRNSGFLWEKWKWWAGGDSNPGPMP